jgi:Predicted pyridoxal phosphate-dependent enzyme apparently involved in regulation of cell wall biogenesis
MDRQASDFRYNTGATQVPWAAVGESYNSADVLEFLRFLVQGKGPAYEAAFAKVASSVEALASVGTPPGKLSLGKRVTTVEGLVDEFLGTSGATLVTNATAGFEIAFRYANLGPGDEVIIPAITFIATMSYPLAVGAKVVLADVDPVTLNLDPRDVARKITSRTKMIVPVHIGGYPVDMDPIMELARDRGILVLEDAAHGFGATYKGRKLGTIGHFGSFSFHEVKNITSFGEGGIVVSSLPFKSQLSKARFLGCDFGRQIPDWLYDVDALEGVRGPFAANNYSATEIQAIGLELQLRRLGEIIAKRRANASHVNERLAGCDALRTQPMGEGATMPTFHLYLLQIDPRKAGGDVRVLRKKLEAKGVTTIPHFAPLYKFSIMRRFGYDVDAIAASCPVAEEAFEHRFTHLPIYGLSDEQIDYMCDAILASVDEMRKGS